jgi:SAM-dependent methyltransferase
MGYFETALAEFGENSFDAVWCFNSLDHSIDPVHGLFNLLSVIKIGGGLVLSFHPNEAEGGKYGGLHQWNLDIDDEGLFLNQKGKQMRLQGLIGQQKIIRRHAPKNATGVQKERVTYLIKKVANVTLSQALLVQFGLSDINCKPTELLGTCSKAPECKKWRPVNVTHSV